MRRRDFLRGLAALPVGAAAVAIGAKPTRDDMERELAQIERQMLAITGLQAGVISNATAARAFGVRLDYETWLARLT